MPDLSLMIVSLGSIPLFASRTFSVSFWIAWMARLQAGGIIASGDALGLFRLDLSSHCPEWLMATPTLLLLALLAFLESSADKSPDIRLLLSELDPYAKALGDYVFTNVGLGLSVTVIAAVGFHAAGIGTLLWATIPAVGVWLIAILRRDVLTALTEFDEDDDLGLRKLISWAEDGWVGMSIFLLVVMPLIALTIAGLTVLGLWIVQRVLQAREKSLMEPCAHCGTQILPSAPSCFSCRRPTAQPKAVGVFGQPTATPMTDLTEHQLQLLSKKRCLVCATRLPKKLLRQPCSACSSEMLPSRAWADRYLAHVHSKLPKTLLVCFGLSLIPVLGLVPGIIYYRLGLVSSLRRYVPPSTGCLTRGVVRLANLLLLAFQWVPFFGAFTLPAMCYLNYAIYRKVLVQQKISSFPPEETRS